ncbi:unnamed protein product [Didymodactylos carnosus]|uniref:Uncharacterized protein n=1 Tax=Didymodactylos carnosus TaxID=1234261 RepID=A0A8S2YY37_9BILA|nr:unnamed protein product [Didymodactylos carnosus]CAF4159265.1 unnamed protein product [Didymodactylos carnosus]CAF4584609.1 unnamed protein product [Didymodactylos carnosus]
MIEVVELRSNDNQSEPTEVTSPDIRSNYIDSEQSSYEEIAGIVSNKDNPDMVIITFRSCLIGILFTALISSLDQYLYYGRGSYALPQLVLLLLTYPLGRLLAWCLPSKPFTISKWKISLNPCSFTIKEHAIIYVMIYIAGQTVAAIDVVVYKQIYEGQTTPFAWGILLALSSQMMGYGAAGK